MMASRVEGPVLDAGCGEGRLASLLAESVWWVGVDSFPVQVAANPYRPILVGDMTRLRHADDSFA